MSSKGTSVSLPQKEIPLVNPYRANGHKTSIALVLAQTVTTYLKHTGIFFTCISAVVFDYGECGPDTLKNPTLRHQIIIYHLSLNRVVRKWWRRAISPPTPVICATYSFR